MKIYILPSFLLRIVPEQKYKIWLQRKAAAHRRRDNKRWGTNYSIAQFKMAIHKAVIKSNGFDDYTGQPLDWRLINSYNNQLSKLNKAKYKKTFNYLPTVDHANPWSKKIDFKICSWILNDVKHDLSIKELKELVDKLNSILIN